MRHGRRGDSVQSTGRFPVVCAGALLAGLLVLSPARLGAQEAGPFNVLAGNWTGNGTITMDSGDRERIRCRVKYEVSQNGNYARQDLRCASDSYKFEMVTDGEYRGGYLYGRWSEITRNVGGQMTGRVVGGMIEALAEGSGFNVTFTVNTRGDRQTVMIRSQAAASDIRLVSISVHRVSR
jgi:hypothetical protein